MLNKRSFTLLFIAVSTVFVLLAYYFISVEKYIAFSLIPIFFAFFAGQYAGRKYSKEEKIEKNKKVVKTETV